MKQLFLSDFGIDNIIYVTSYFNVVDTHDTTLINYF